MPRRAEEYLPPLEVAAWLRGLAHSTRYRSDLIEHGWRSAQKAAEALTEAARAIEDRHHILGVMANSSALSAADAAAPARSSSPRRAAS